ncbi:MAG: hypothetical protein KJZ93_30350 [Caldilineaceae bacterium]|nr:hypothetical protein [Caldilineaceae bacterium]
MPHQVTTIPEELLEFSKQLEQWRSVHPSRSRLPESIWVTAVEMAQRYGLHRVAKALRLDYMRLKKRMPGAVPQAGPPPAFLELLGPAAAGPAECVVEWESARGRMRVAMKGVTPDWAGLLRAWRES